MIDCFECLSGAPDASFRVVYSRPGAIARFRVVQESSTCSRAGDLRDTVRCQRRSVPARIIPAPRGGCLSLREKRLDVMNGI